MLFSLLLAFSCNPKLPSIQTATSGSSTSSPPGSLARGKSTTPEASSKEDYLEKFLFDATTCDRPFGDNSALKYVSPQAVNRIKGDIKINGYCYDQWNVASSREVYSPAAGTEFTVAISNEGSFCHRLTILVVDEGNGYAIYPGEYSPDSSYLDPWQRVDAWIDGSPECPNNATVGGGGGTVTTGTTGTTSPGAKAFMESFISLNNCDGPAPMTSYVSEKELRKRNIPTTGQKINNFCYDAWNIVNYEQTGDKTKVVATIGNESYCHELTYEIVEEAGSYRMVPGTWHNDTSYVDPWVSERRNLSDSTCPTVGGVVGGVIGGSSGGVYASSPRAFMDSFMDLNNCDGPGLNYLSESHMNDRAIPTSGININNFCYESWTILSERSSPSGTQFVATIGNDSYCHQLTYDVVDHGGNMYSLVPGTHHADTGYVDPWTSEVRSVSDPTCQSEGGSGAIGTLGVVGTPAGADGFMEDFISRNNCEAPSPTTGYVSSKGLAARSIPSTETINNFCYDGWNIHSKSVSGAKTTYVATVGNAGGFCHELTYEVVQEDGGYRMTPGTHHADVNYVDPWTRESRDINSGKCPTYPGAQNTYAAEMLLGGLMGPSGGGVGSGGSLGTSYSSDDEFMEDFVSLHNCNSPMPTDTYVSTAGMTAKGIPWTEQINNFCYDSWNIHTKESQGSKSVYKVNIGGDGWCNELVYEVILEDGKYKAMPGIHHADVNYVDPWVSERRSISDAACPTGYGAKNTYTRGGPGLNTNGGGAGVAPTSDPDAFMETWKELGNGCGMTDPPSSYLSPTHLSAMGLSPSSVKVNNYCYDEFTVIDEKKVSDGQEYTALIGMTGSWCHKLTYVVTSDGLKPGENHTDGYVNPWVASQQWIEDPRCP